MTSAPDWQRVISIAGADTLNSFTPNLAAGASSSVNAGTAIRSYSGFLVNIWPEAGGAGKRIAVRIINNTRSYVSAAQTVQIPSVNWPGGGSSPGVVLGFPVEAVQGDQIEVEFFGIDAAFFFAAVIGVSVMPGNLPTLRPDGRLPPVGTKRDSNFVNALATTNVINAPGAGLSILLKSLQAVIGSTGGGNAYGEAGGTVAGNTTDLLAITASSTVGGQDGIEWESGLLLDVNTALTISVSGVATICRLIAVYDVVV